MSDDTTRDLIHDLRNALGPAMLMAERLTMQADPKIQHAGKVILDSLDCATALMRSFQAKNAS